jgi:hypothetical protein
MHVCSGKRRHRRQILHRTKPGDISFEQPSKLELVINLRSLAEED